MKTIRVTRNTFVDSVLLGVGEIVEMEDATANRIIQMGKAVEEVASPVIEEAATSPKKGAKK